MRIKLTIAYDGANYFGWQLQSGQDSIQARLEAALERIFSTPVRVHGSGRTDTGVHARGQVAAVTLPRAFEASDLQRALNAILPDDIVIEKIETVADDFDPRRDATSRVYEYRILNQQLPSPFERRYAWLIREPLNIDVMNEAARVFLGEHDFAGFRTLGTEVKSTVRRVIASEWTRSGALLTYRVEATSFLRHMVRTMVAAMVEAGRGRISPRAVADLLQSRDRALAPASAPPQGLFLREVRY
ncbi:MAG TPA: tRNA pseudouridine(38-40) synthase TruA [Candidatus Binataceae bacterium]|nr:tRNA pseudouridine(38-40) synthase TruA [Candidatus Binataceae bacterium]